MNPLSFDQNRQDLTAGVIRPVIKVLGLGGGGCNAVQRMIELGLGGVEFIAANTDRQALAKNPAPTKILLGPQTTRGLGAGGDPRIGQMAAEESCKDLSRVLAGADMVFLTAGMGGGTGSGSIAVAARVARQIGAVTIAIVTLPFSFEMGRRQRNATESLARLRMHTHTLIAIENDRLLQAAPRNLPMETAFRFADDVLRQSVQGITELITQPGLINIDFAHIKRLIERGGGAIMAIGQGKGEFKAHEALDQAMHHPLLDMISLEHAAGIIANFTGGPDLTLFEVTESVKLLQDSAGGDTDLILGVTNDDAMEGRAQVILIVTGLGGTSLEDAVASLPRTAVQPAAVPPSNAARTLPVERSMPATPSSPRTAAPAQAQWQPARPASIRRPSELPEYKPTPHALPAEPAKPANLPPSEPAFFASAATAAARPARMPEMLASSSNLDLPAFLRRRARLTGQA